MENQTHDDSELFKDGDEESNYIMHPRYIRHNYIMSALPLNIQPSTCCCCCSNPQFPVIDADIYRKLSMEKRTRINAWRMQYMKIRKTNEAAILSAEAEFYDNIAKSLGSKLK